MTQPRREQIKNLTTQFSPLVGSAFSTLAKDKTKDTYSLTNLTAFLASTVTGVFGGAEVSVPGILQSNTVGPYSIAATSQISVTIPGVNSGNPVTVTFVAGDVVVLNGFNVITTSRVAERINLALAAYGVTYAVASNYQGYLKLVSAVGSAVITGDSASINIKDITAGIITNLGFGAVSTITATGSTGPKRGIANTSVDGLGGYMPLRLADGSPATTQVRSRLNIGYRLNVGDVEPGNKIFGRLTSQPTASPNPTVTIDYKYIGTQSASLITRLSNFTTLAPGDPVSTVTVADSTQPVPLNSVSFTVSFASPPTTVADVVTVFNTAWHTATEALAAGFGAGRAVVPAKNSGPYMFTNTTGLPEAFYISVNGGAAVLLSFTGTMTVAQVVSYISGAISGATAVSYTDSFGNISFGIATTSTNATGTINITPGPPALLATDMRALDKLGIAPGLYKASTIAKLYGADEIQLSNPSLSSVSTFSISGNSTVFQKLGFPTGVSPQSAVVTSAEAVATFPSYVGQVLIPEVLEFGEIPPALQDTIQRWSAPQKQPAPVSTAGVVNVGLNLVANADGKIDPGYIPKILDYLNIDHITLGSKLTGNIDDASIPRVGVAYDSVGNSFVLLLDVPDSSSSHARLRVYVKGAAGTQSLIITHNAKLTAASTWAKDSAGSDASYTQFEKGKVIQRYVRAADATPFADGAWIQPNTIDPTGFAGSSIGYLQIGQGGATEVTRGDNLIPRLNTKPVADGTSYTCVWQSFLPASATIGYRLYVAPAAANGPMHLTVNASWNGSAWVKDVAAASASAFVMNGEDTSVVYRLAASAGTWTTWDQTPVKFAGANLMATFSGGATLGNELPLTALGRATARLITNHEVSGSLLRTLIHKSTGGSGANTYKYRGVGLAGGPNVGSGSDVYMIAQNASWDGTNWTRDVSYMTSMLQVYTGYSIQEYFRSSGTSLSNTTPWTDTGWVLYRELTPYGLALPTSGTGTLNPYNLMAQPNTLTSVNIPKAWGSFTFYRDGGGTLTITAGDSWGISTSGLDGTGYIMLANLSVPMFNTTYSIIATPRPYALANDTITAVPISVSQIGFYATPYGGFTSKNFNAPSTGASFQFVVFGRQS